MYCNKIKIWRSSQLSQLSNRLLTTFTGQPFSVLPDTLISSDIQLSTAKEKAQKLLYYHEKINKVCLEGGGEKGQALHVQKNKKILPREKIKSVFDEGSDTLELCLQAGLGLEYGDVPGGSTVCIIGKVHSQYCLVTANDGTLKGGTFFPITVKKSTRAQEVSAMNHIPNIYIVDSGGGFLPLQSELFPDKLHGGRAFYNQAVDGAKGIPQLALVCGSCTAGGAYVPMMCDDAGIVHKLGYIFLGGPPLVKAATGETITTEALGGATLHCYTSGCTDYFASTEQEGFDMLRDAVATLDISPPPSSASDSQPPQYDPKDLDVLIGLNKIDRPRLLGVIARVVDGGRMREFKHGYGKHLVTGYALLNQRCVGVIANHGPLTYEDGVKGAHFAQTCDQRNLPMIFLQNSGSCQEYWSSMSSLTAEESANLLRGRAMMMTAVSCARVPKVALNIGGCHGDDNYTMCGPSFAPNFIFCWPGTEMTLRPPPEILPSTDSAEPKEQPDKKKSKKPPSPFSFPSHSSWYLASRSVVDGIITPSDSRKVLIQCLRIFEQKTRINCKEKDSPVFRF